MLVVTACGRIGFDPPEHGAPGDDAATGDAGDPDADPGGDAPPPSAITVTKLAADHNNGCGGTQTTAAVAPSPNELVVVGVSDTTAAGAGPTVTLTGAGLTWVEIASIVHPNDTRLRYTLFRSMGAAPASGPLTMTFAQNPLSCAWSVLQFGNVDTSGADGAGAIVQSMTATTAGNATSVAVALAPFASVADATFGTMVANTNGPITAGAGFQELDEIGFGSVLAISLQTQWQPASDTSIDWSWSGASLGAGIALELAHP
jgi:hypothetical protein